MRNAVLLALALLVLTAGAGWAGEKNALASWPGASLVYYHADW